MNIISWGVDEICENKPFYDPYMDNMLFYVNKCKLPLTEKDFMM